MDLSQLKALASEARDRPYVSPLEAPASAELDALTYGPLQDIRYPPANALFPASPYPVTFFHLGNFFRHVPGLKTAAEDAPADEYSSAGVQQSGTDPPLTAEPRTWRKDEYPD